MFFFSVSNKVLFLRVFELMYFSSDLRGNVGRPSETNGPYEVRLIISVATNVSNVRLQTYLWLGCQIFRTFPINSKMVAC